VIGGKEDPLSRTVLVADPDPAERRKVGDTLRTAGYEVIEAGTGGEALQQALLQWPDVLVLDADLSGVTAWDVLEQLRSSSGVDEMRVVVYSGEGADPTPSSEGAVEVVTKPIDLRELLQAVENALASEPDGVAADGFTPRPRGKIEEVVAGEAPGERVVTQADALMRVAGQLYTRCKVVLTEGHVLVLKQAWPWGYRAAVSADIRSCRVAHRGDRFDGTTLLDLETGSGVSSLYFGRRWQKPAAQIAAAIGD
jgi:CheY-like chemotaxis protein